MKSGAQKLADLAASQSVQVAQDDQGNLYYTPKPPELNVSRFKTSVLTNVYSVAAWELDGAEYQQKHKPALTFEPQHQFVEDKEGESTVCLAKCTGATYEFPRTYGLRMFGPPAKDLRYSKPMKSDRWKFNGKLYHPVRNPGRAGTNQEAIVAHTLQQLIHSPYHSGHLLAATSAGKTSMFCYIASFLGERAIFVVPRRNLGDQAISRFKQWLPNARIGRLWQGVIDVKDKDIVVARLPSLAQHEYPPGTLDGFGLVAFDEIHYTFAKRNQSVLKLLANAKHMLGLTATMDRQDEMHLLGLEALGPVVFQSNPATNVTRKLHIERVTFTHQDMLVWKRKIRGEWKVSHQDTGRELTFVDARTMAILHEVDCKLALGHRIIIFTMFVEFGKRLYESLRQDYPRLVMVLYTAALSDKQRVAIDENEHDIIIGTPSILGTGTDFSYIDAQIHATPAKEIRQSLGRIRDNATSDLPPCVVDIRDGKSIYRGQAYARDQEYKRRECILEPARAALTADERDQARVNAVRASLMKLGVPDRLTGDAPALKSRLQIAKLISEYASSDSTWRLEQVRRIDWSSIKKPPGGPGQVLDGHENEDLTLHPILSQRPYKLSATKVQQEDNASAPGQKRKRSSSSGRGRGRGRGRGASGGRGSKKMKSSNPLLG